MDEWDGGLRCPLHALDDVTVLAQRVLDGLLRQRPDEHALQTDGKYRIRIEELAGQKS